MENRPGQEKGVASLVLGIVSIWMFFTMLLIPFGFICAATGFFLGKSARNIQVPVTGIASAGYVCSIIGCALNIMGLIFWIFFFSYFLDIFRIALLMGSQ